ncbi:MAG TPA: hypothetical protein VIK91_12730 [Nannocystis sp.]
MRSPRRLPVLLACVLALTPALASASYPAGVWALVEKVTLEPDPGKPTRIRIDGLFMVANQDPDFPAYPGYSVPRYGYMYYQCDEKQLAVCQMEWQELAAVAMSEDRCRGWGDSNLPDNGVVRTVEPMEKPDTWPISMGILIGFTPCDALKAWMAENPPGGDTSGTDGESSDGSGGESSGGSESSGGGESSGGFNSGSSGGEDDGSSGGGESSGNTASTSGGDPATTGPSPTSGPSAGSAGETGDAGSSSGGAPADTGQTPGGDKGCACDLRDPSRPTTALALLLALLVRPRRRARA